VKPNFGSTTPNSTKENVEIVMLDVVARFVFGPSRLGCVWMEGLGGEGRGEFTFPF